MNNEKKFHFLESCSLLREGAIIKKLGKMGGYVVASVHNIQADVPPENILAMAKSAHDFGRY